MGLDMYLRAKRLLSVGSVSDTKVIDAIVDQGIQGMGDMIPSEITCRAMYWRKANHIHQWFVENVQDHDDDCRDYAVGVEQLHDLMDACKAVLADRSKAGQILPTTDGFFFGGTEYDQYYFDETQRTLDTLQKILSTDGIENWYFEYQSSW